MDPDLTLEKAVTSARQKESVRKQQPLLKGDPAESSLPQEDPLPNVDTVVKKPTVLHKPTFPQNQRKPLLHNATGVVDPSTEDTNAQLSMLFVISVNAEVTSRNLPIHLPSARSAGGELSSTESTRSILLGNSTGESD